MLHIRKEQQVFGPEELEDPVDGLGWARLGWVLKFFRPNELLLKKDSAAWGKQASK